MGCRKNYRDLTPTEKDRFVQALHHLKSTGIIDQFASDHETYFHDAHHSSHFLPWHREFLRRFEDHLRTFDPNISIPYWNSTEDQSTSDPLWGNSFLGQFDSAWGLDRSLGSDTLPPPANVTTALGTTPFSSLWPYIEGNALHNPPHNWVTGVMGTAASPGDPVFYLHHCWIDLIWAQWQLQNPTEVYESSGSGRGLNDAMAPWSTTPADVMDHRTINSYHYPAGLQEDLPVVENETPAVNFLDVPEGETRMAAAVFDIQGCEPVHLNITSGPTLVSGPPTTVFGVISPSITANPSLDPKGRLWFTYLGTAGGDTAVGTVTIHCEETDEDFVVSLTANTIPKQKAAVVLVFDRSNSMNFDSGIAPGITRADVLRFSAAPAVIVVDDEHAMAVCTFDHDALPGIGMTVIAGGGNILINGVVSSYSPNSNGWTSIGEGVAFAHDILDPVTGYDVKAMIVLTDGQENHGPHTRRSIADVADLITGLNGHVFAIGLGRPEVLNSGALEALCSGNRGYMVTTGDLSSSASFRLSKYYQQILAGVTNNEIVLDPEGYISTGQVHRIPFWLNEADIHAKAILLTTANGGIQFVLETPDGDIIDPGEASSNPMASFEISNLVSLYRTGLPIPIGSNQAHAGKWHAILKIDSKYKQYTHVGTAAQSGVHGIHYSLNVHAYSNLRMKVMLSQSSNEIGCTITLRAVLTEYGVPVANRAFCKAELTKPDSSFSTISMSEVEPGAFEVSVVASQSGVYHFRVLAEGKTSRGRKFTREQIRTGSVWRGGDRPAPDPNGNNKKDDDCTCHIFACLLRDKGIQEALRKHGVNFEELKKCLKKYDTKPVTPIKRATLSNRLKLMIPDAATLTRVLREIDREKGTE